MLAGASEPGGGMQKLWRDLMGICQAKLAFSQGAGLIENNCVDLGKPLQCIAGLDQNA